MWIITGVLLGMFCLAALVGFHAGPHAHGVAVVARLAERAVQYRDLVMAGRSHNVAAQATTLGKRFASAAQASAYHPWPEFSCTQELPASIDIEILVSRPPAKSVLPSPEIAIADQFVALESIVQVVPESTETANPDPPAAAT